MALVRSRGEQVRPGIFAAASPDPADDTFLACAISAAADVIVTGNKRDFPPTACGAVQVVSAGELLEWITCEM